MAVIYSGNPKLAADWAWNLRMTLRCCYAAVAKMTAYGTREAFDTVGSIRRNVNHT